MKRADMVCAKCIKGMLLEFCDGALVVNCHLNPAIVTITVDFRVNLVPEKGSIIVPLDPRTHWCAQGEWREWNDRHKEWTKLFWGEWETDADGETVA